MSTNGTDQTGAIQSALDSAENNSTVEFPKGDVRIDGDIVIPNKRLKVRLNSGVYTLGGSIIISGEKSVFIEGRGPGQTSIVGTKAGQSLIRAEGANTSAGVNRATVIKNLKLDGANVAAYGFWTPDNAPGVFSMLNGNTVFEDLVVCRFAEAGIHSGRSTYFMHVDRCSFDSNKVGLSTGHYTDCTTYRSVFGPHTLAGILSRGCQQRILASTFTGQGATGADILIAPTETAGTVFIGAGCYFGNEGETAGRAKIVCDSEHPVVAVLIKDSFFYGVVGQSCIKVAAPIANWNVAGNLFQGFSTIIDDNFVPAGVTTGNGVFKDNMVWGYGPNSCRVFSNSGVGFSSVEYPPNTAGINVPDISRGIQNRIHHSNDFTAGGEYGWALSAGLTNSNGTLAHDGSGSSKSLTAKINTSALVDDSGSAATGYRGRLVASFTAKAGTLSVLGVGIYDATDARFVQSQNFTLSPNGKTYLFPVAGVDGSHAIQIRFYPGGATSAAAGTLTVADVSVSDYGSSYAATNGAAVGVP